MNEDIAVKMQKYIEECHTHFYQEGEGKKEMVEYMLMTTMYTIFKIIIITYLIKDH